MRGAFSLIWLALIGLFRSRASLQVEILTLRHQLNVLRRKSPQRLTFTSIDRLVFAGLYRLAPGVLAALKIVGPETVIRWHRAGFRAYWRWESKTAQWPSKDPAGNPSAHSRDQSRQPIMGRTTDSWRASQARHRCRTNHRCKVYGKGKATAVPGVEDVLHNHADGIASIDLFAVPTISFRLLYGLLILQHDRRQILWLGVTFLLPLGEARDRNNGTSNDQMRLQASLIRQKHC